MRKSYDELLKIANKLKCNDIYSWSKINTFNEDTYNYFLRYVLKIPEDRNDSIYAPLGTIAHDSLEKFYKNKLKHNGMLEYFEEKLFEYTVAGMKYDRSDEEKNKKIGNKYEDCLRHFFKNHIKIKGKPKLELFVPLKLNNSMFQCYIDFVHNEKRVIDNEEKDVIVITDWKTSTIYKGEKLEKEKGQLILYGMAIAQKLKIPINQIIIRWCFLKYVNIDCVQANGNTKVRTIERNDIGNSLLSSVKMWLKKSSLKLTDEDIDNHILKLIGTNSIDELPDDVKDKFSISDCYTEVQFDQEAIDELNEKLLNIVQQIKEKENEYKETKNSKIWWQEVTDKDSYRLANLSGYSAKIHRPYKEYLDNLNLFMNKKETDNDEEIQDSSDINLSVKETQKDEDDLSWLNDLL